MNAAAIGITFEQVPSLTRRKIDAARFCFVSVNRTNLLRGYEIFVKIYGVYFGYACLVLCVTTYKNLETVIRWLLPIIVSILIVVYS